MYKLDLEKSEELEIKLPTSVGSLKKQDSSRKTSTHYLAPSLASPLPRMKAGARSSGSLSRRSLQHSDAHAPRGQRPSTPSSFTLEHAQSPISPQATAHYLARGMGLGK